MAGKPLSRYLPSGGCKGLTKQAKPCNAKNVYENGFCKYHGGQGQSLVDRRANLKFRLDKDKGERLAKRIDRLLRRTPPHVRELVERIKARQKAQA